MRDSLYSTESRLSSGSRSSNDSWYARNSWSSRDSLYSTESRLSSASLFSSKSRPLNDSEHSSDNQETSQGLKAHKWNISKVVAQCQRNNIILASTTKFPEPSRRAQVGSNVRNFIRDRMAMQKPAPYLHKLTASQLTARVSKQKSEIRCITDRKHQNFKLIAFKRV
ncbi:unnamed protein product [Ceratitis capitata]|uniref:(Mediterranean fruit fly) hypothetical protein n=1 Tax=Ceratitis capitata TaxID=7213 RepID=A0A811UMV2_CERCA|nr:unnamed protein product [Ceratitis capitata]